MDTSISYSASVFILIYIEITSILFISYWSIFLFFYFSKSNTKLTFVIFCHDK